MPTTETTTIEQQARELMGKCMNISDLVDSFGVRKKAAKDIAMLVIASCFEYAEWDNDRQELEELKEYIQTNY